MVAINNLIDLKIYHPKLYTWMINAFTKHGFVYCISPKTLGKSVLRKLNINLNLPVFIKKTSSLLPNDYVQFDYGRMNVSDCISDKSGEFVDKLMGEFNQKINNPYNIRLSLSSAKKRYPIAYKFLITSLARHGFNYVPTASVYKKPSDIAPNVLINDPNSDVFAIKTSGGSTYLQLTSDGYWNLALCNSYVKPIALAIIRQFFNLVHKADIKQKSSMKYLGIVDAVYYDASYNSDNPNLEVPIISFEGGHANINLINLYRIGTKEFLSNIPLITKSQVKIIESEHLANNSIIWIPYDHQFCDKFLTYIENLMPRFFNRQMDHYVTVLGASYNKLHHIFFDLLVRTKDPKHPFKVVNESLSSLTDNDDICLTSKEMRSKAYKIYIKYHSFYAKRIHVDSHLFHNLKAYAKSMPNRQRYLVVLSVTGNPLKPRSLKFDALGFSKSGDCHKYDNVPLSDLIYNPKYYMSKDQYPLAIRFNSYNNSHNPTVIPLDAYIYESLSSFVKDFEK